MRTISSPAPVILACRKGEQSQHRDTHLAEILALPPMRWTLQVGIIGADITELTISLTVVVA